MPDTSLHVNQQPGSNPRYTQIMCLNFLKTPNSTNSYENCFSLHIPLAFHHISKFVPSFEARNPTLPSHCHPIAIPPSGGPSWPRVRTCLGCARTSLWPRRGATRSHRWPRSLWSTQDIEYEQKQQINHVVINPDIR